MQCIYFLIFGGEERVRAGEEAEGKRKEREREIERVYLKQTLHSRQSQMPGMENNSGVTTQAKIKGWALNQMNHPSAPAV